MLAQDPEYLTIPEAASLLRVKPKTAYHWATHGKLPSVKINGRRVVSRRVLIEWAEANGKEKKHHGPSK